MLPTATSSTGQWRESNPRSGSLALPVAAKPSGAVVGRNDFGSLGYRGPCPPAGPAHDYRITAYALGQPSGLKQGFSAGEVTALGDRRARCGWWLLVEPAGTAWPVGCTTTES
jgi:hypothetical protein